MTNKELKESLNRIDRLAFDNNTTYYDLRNLYESVNMTAQERADLARKVQDAKSDEDYAEISGFLNGKLGKDIKNEDFDQYDFDEEEPTDDADFIHTYEVVFYNDNGQVDSSRCKEFNDEDEAIEYAKENDADSVTDWFYDKEDPQIPNYSETIWDNTGSEYEYAKEIKEFIDNHPYDNIDSHEDPEDLASELCDNVFGLDYYKAPSKISRACFNAAEDIIYEAEGNQVMDVDWEPELIDESMLNEDSAAVAVHDLTNVLADRLFAQKYKVKEILNSNPRLVNMYLKSGMKPEEYIDKQIDYYGINKFSDWFFHGTREKYPNEYEEPKKTFKFEDLNDDGDEQVDSSIDELLDRIDMANKEELRIIYEVVDLGLKYMPKEDGDRVLEAIYDRLDDLGEIEYED